MKNKSNLFNKKRENNYQPKKKFKDKKNFGQSFDSNFVKQSIDYMYWYYFYLYNNGHFHIRSKFKHKLNKYEEQKTPKSEQHINGNQLNENKKGEKIKILKENFL